MPDMKIVADFSKISSSFEPLPAGDYICRIEEIEEVKSQENQIPGLKFTLVVDDPAHPDETDRQLFDNVWLQQKDGKPNKIGLGRIKAYVEATEGAEAANNPEGLDVGAVKGSKVIAVVKQRGWEKKDSSGTVQDSGIGNDVKKILPVG